MRAIFLFLNFLVCWNLMGCDKDSESGPEPSTPPSGNTVAQVFGFTLKIATDFTWNSETDNAYRYLSKNLDELGSIIPEPALLKMKKITFVIRDAKDKPLIEYLSDDTEKADTIIFNDLLQYYQTSLQKQPSLLLHFLARQYQHRYLSAYTDKIEEAYREAVESGIYTNIPENGLTFSDPIDYFAELSETYWGKNNGYPCDYHDLQQFDPKGFALMEYFWGERAIKQYNRYQINGYDVMVLKTHENNPLTAEALPFLQSKLEEINRLVPREFTDFFKRRKIWMEIGSGSTIGGAAEYHPDRGWLIDNGRLPEKYNCIEISNMENFIKWCKANQPMMILHELAHMYQLNAYKDGILITSAFEQAQNSHIYDLVDYNTGNEIVKQKAYAMDNEKEYFSEITEAYFGENDYYPFRKEQLKTFDPVGYQLMEYIWNPIHFKE